MISLFRRRKADLSIDTFIIPIVIIILFLLVAIIYIAVDSFMPDTIQMINETQPVNSSAANMAASNYAKWPAMMDSAVVFLFVALWLAGLVTSFFIDTHPIFFIIAVLFLGAMLIVMVFIDTSIKFLAEDTMFDVVKTGLPMSYWLATHSLIVFVFVGMTIGIALFAKSRTQ